MNLRKRILRWGCALFLAAGTGALILAGAGFARAPSDWDPAKSCAAALRAQGWSVSIAAPGVETRRAFEASDWRAVLYTTDVALGAYACRDFAVRSACIGPGCAGTSSIVFVREQRPTF